MDTKRQNTIFPGPSKLPWGLVPVLYFGLVVVSHEWVSTVYSQVVRHFGRSKMESTLSGASWVLGVLVGSWCLFMFKQRDKEAIRLLLLWGAVLSLMVVADGLLIVTNIERIHYPQYALLAILLRMALSDDFLVIVLATLAGMLDEFVQFVWNPQYTKYLDFNDFVLNALGAVAGVLLFRTLWTKDRQATESLPKVRGWTYGVTGAVLLMTGLAVWAGRIMPYRAGEEGFEVLTQVGGKLTFVLSFVTHPNSWTVSEYGRSYHVLSGLEGLVVLALVLLVCRFLLGRDFGR